MSAFAAMNNSMTAAAFAAAGSRARCASMSAIILDAIILASIFVVLSIPVLVLVLAISVVLVRIILGLVVPSGTICHKAMSQT